MGDLCRQCALEFCGEDAGDLAGLIPVHQRRRMTCEGCGPTLVDHLGRCADPRCKKHRRKKRTPAIAAGEARP